MVALPGKTNREVARRTLSIHEVGNGDWVISLNIGNHAVKHNAVVGLARADADVLLAEMLELGVDGNGFLHATIINNGQGDVDGRKPYELLRKRDFLQLHLVDSTLGRTQQQSCGQQSALHLRRRGRSAGRDRGEQKSRSARTIEFLGNHGENGDKRRYRRLRRWVE